MNLHKVVADLIDAQNNHDHFAYANCFSEAAIVLDEGHTYRGKAEIQKWIKQADQQYQTILKPVSYEETESGNLLQAEASGNFPGSPAILRFHLQVADGLIHSLKITG